MLSIDYLSELANRYSSVLKSKVAEFSIGNQPFAFNGKPAIMGVVNLSSDSWYRESVCLNAQQAIQRGKLLSLQGANIIDLGAESTLANASRQSAMQQVERLMPVLRELAQCNILVSIETYEPEVAHECLKAGAKLINLTGNIHSEKIYELVAQNEAAVIICYVQGQHVRSVGDYDFGNDPTDLMHDYFGREIDLARKMGVTRIIIDPGLGFYYRNLQDSALRIRHQMHTFLNTFRLRALGHPVCHALPHAFEFFGEEVRCAEPFFAVLASLGKTDLFRTHEVPRIKAVLDTLSCFDYR